MKGYSWPGNIRELRNLIDRLIILTDTPVIDKPTLTRFLSYATSQKTSSLETFVNTVLDMPEKGDKLALMEQLLILKITKYQLNSTFPVMMMYGYLSMAS